MRKIAAVLSVLVLSVSACGSSGGGAKADALYYVSVGDSYASGYQPTDKDHGHTTTNGFAYQLVPLAKAKGHDLTLVNFGCSGATTASVLQQQGCKVDALGPDALSYDGRTQADAAVDFINQHKGKIGLITVSIGGNDVTQCADSDNAVTCLTQAIPKLSANLTDLLTKLRTAAGKDAPIVGITYPDVYLASKDAQLATLSTLAFTSFINPALKKAYEGAGGTFVDVTHATGTDVATGKQKVCDLTYFCQYGDIHPHTDGYKLIADLIVATLH